MSNVHHLEKVYNSLFHNWKQWSSNFSIWFRWLLGFIQAFVASEWSSSLPPLSPSLSILATVATFLVMTSSTSFRFSPIVHFTGWADFCGFPGIILFFWTVETERNSALIALKKLNSQNTFRKLKVMHFFKLKRKHRHWTLEW